MIAVDWVYSRRREHPRCETPFDPDGTYSVSTWDHEDQRWDEVRSGLSLMSLRRAIRALEDSGWSSVSYLVSREPT